MSNFYGSVAKADDYHAERGNTAWVEATTAAKEIALLNGSEYIDFAFRDEFPGWKTGRREQVREWPRIYAYDIYHNNITSDTIPFEVEHASYEAALRELAEPGSLLPDFVQGNQIDSVSIDGALSVKFSGSMGVSNTKPIIMIITGIIRPVLVRAMSKNVGTSVRV